MVKNEGKTKSKSLPKENGNPLKDDLAHFGYLLPTNDEELEEFDKIYGTTQVIIPEHLKKPDFLFSKRKEHELKPIESGNAKKSTKSKGTTTKTNKETDTQHDYFKKVVLAAEIVNQLHEELTFGHIKFVKLLFLCQEVCYMKLSTAYGKYAAGPLDPILLHTVDKEFIKQKWFNITRTEYGGYRYAPAENIERYKSYYANYYSLQADKINEIIDLFRKAKSDFCEIVATLFAVWKENISNNILINDATLIQGFYSWSKEKKRFDESELLKTIKWMQEKNIVPISSL